MEKKFHTKHQPVLLSLVLEKMDFKPGQVILDATLGGGGYSVAILERIAPSGRVIALDWDERAIENFQREGESSTFVSQAIAEKKLVLVHESFANLGHVLSEKGVQSLDGIVADLGLSSDQLEDPARGLSFQMDGPLDMRLNSREKVTAAKIVNTFSVEKLTDLFRVYGDEREAKKIAVAIEKRRKAMPFERTGELATLIQETVAKRRNFGRIHPATQVFQALRIAVNSERRALEDFLPQAVAALRTGGKIAIVTFHSGEDAIVKHFFQKEARGCVCGLVPCICGKRATLRIHTKKPLLASEEEQKQNPRSRSAKLRIAEKIS